VRDRAEGTTELITIDTNGDPANGDSRFAVLSGGGRFVTFQSRASDLVVGDDNGTIDVFLFDAETGEISRISEGLGGSEANGISYDPYISPDGRFVTFSSVATNLVSNDTNDIDDVFVFKRETGSITRVSVASGGKQANHGSFDGILSANGRLVTFTSLASNLDPDDENSEFEIFIHNRRRDRTTLVSVNDRWPHRRGRSIMSRLSPSGRYVVFTSFRDHLVRGDDNGTGDIYIKDRKTGRLEIVSVNARGREGNNVSYEPVVSGGGKFVAYYSLAGNLVEGDDNHRFDVFLRNRSCA
jgi:Tol biopolymer transport system component